MLQVDHIYEFFTNILFKDFNSYYFHNGVIENQAFKIFTVSNSPYKILFYDQEPFLPELSKKYVSYIISPEQMSIDEIKHYIRNGLQIPQAKAIGLTPDSVIPDQNFDVSLFYNHTHILATSEISNIPKYFDDKFYFHTLYYFYHGFAALDWYRGYHLLNFNKTTKMSYKHDFVSYNRIITDDRSYRIYFVSKLIEAGLLDKGQVSFNVTDNMFDDWRDEVANPDTKLSEHARQHAERHLTDVDKLVIDKPQLPGGASADILREIDALWNIVTETVFYYDKLHLTEKIFKPIVSKQPFMLLAAPGNLAYLRSYGFKTFDGIINESYDNIIDNDARIEAVVKELEWYCNLAPGEKADIIEEITPIVEYNFNHFYGEFRHIITRELLDNCKALFKEIGYDGSTIAYDNIYKVLTS